MKNKGDKKSVVFRVSILLVSMFFLTSPKVIFAASIVDALQPSTAATGDIFRAVAKDFVPKVVSPTAKIISTPFKSLKIDDSQFSNGNTASVSSAIKSTWNSFLNFFTKDDVAINEPVPTKPATVSVTNKVENSSGPIVYNPQASIVQNVNSNVDESFLQRQIDTLTSRLNSIFSNNNDQNTTSAPVTVVNNYITNSSSPAVTYVTSGGGIGDSSLTGFSQGITNQITEVRNDLTAAIAGVDVSNLNDVTVDGAITLNDITPPATTTSLLYNDAGDLYWAGNIIAGGAVGSWNSNGTDIYRLSGNIGLGTASPSLGGTSAQAARKYLTIKGSTGSGVLQLTSAAADNDSVNQGNIEWVDSNSVSADKRLGYLNIFTSGTTTNNRGSFMAFGTRQNNGSFAQERMRIDNVGNVDIGTYSPGAKLTVSGNGIFGGNVGIGTTNPSGTLDVAGVESFFGTPLGGSRLVARLSDGSTSNQIGIWLRYTNDNMYIDSAADNVFRTTISNTERMRLTTAGNLGIGTSTPAEKISVIGNINTSGNLRVNTGNNAVYLGPSDVSGYTGMWTSVDTVTPTVNNYTVMSGGGATYLNTTGSYLAFRINNGADLLNISSTAATFGGNVGIGTTTPAAKLDVYGSAGSADVFAVSSSTNARLFTVSAAGNVGIGISNPSAILDVGGYGASAYGYQLIAGFKGDTSSQATLEMKNANGSGGNSIILGPSTNNDLIISQFGPSNVSTIYGFPAWSVGQIIASSNFIAGSVGPGNAVFVTNNTERMRIDSIGNVGIGTTTPAAKLEVVGSALVNGNNIAYYPGYGSAYYYGNFSQSQFWEGTKLNFNTSSGDGMSFDVAGQTNLALLGPTSGGPGVTIYGRGGQKSLAVQAISGQTSNLQEWQDYTGTPLSTVTSTGNFGIGTSTPDVKLSVVNASSTGYIFKASGAGGAGAGIYVDASGRTSFMAKGENFDGNGGAYFAADGYQETWFNLTTRSNTPGLLNMRFGNMSDRFSIQRLNDGATAVVSTPLSIANEAPSDSFYMTSSGNVGIGRNDPAVKLEVSGSAATDQIGTENMFSLFRSGTGNTYPQLATLSLGSWAPSGGGGPPGYTFGPTTRLDIKLKQSADTTKTANVTVMSLLDNGNVGIGTTTPGSQLTTTGTVQFAGITGGNLVADAQGNITASSDETLKDIQGNFTRGLEDIMKINPISYHWKASTGYDTANLYSGFSAQNIQGAIPEAVLLNKQGTLSLQDRPILAAAINAIKQLGSVFTKIEGGVAYMKEVWFTGSIHIDNNVCVDDVCISKQQFKQMLLNSGAAQVIPPPDIQVPDATSTEIIEEVVPPVEAEQEQIVPIISENTETEGETI